MPKKGDVVRVGKSVLGQDYHAEGPVTAIQHRQDELLVQVQSDWWLATNDAENSFKITVSRQPTVVPVARKKTAFDFDGGFGIGGINRHQATASEEIELLEARIRHAEREKKRVRKGPLPHGQLWQPCPICGREPVCVECELCEYHCDC